MNLEKLHEQTYASTVSQNQMLFQEMMSLVKLKNTWIAQLITISATVLGGVSMFSNNKNNIVYIGLGILFITIIIGLVLIIKNLNKFSNKIAMYYGLFNDYNLRVLMLIEHKMNNETNEIKRLENELEIIAEKLEIFDDNGNLKMISDDITEKNINIANYILIFGLSIGGILITMSEIIIKICG